MKNRKDGNRLNFHKLFLGVSLNAVSLTVVRICVLSCSFSRLIRMSTYLPWMNMFSQHNHFTGWLREVGLGVT